MELPFFVKRILGFIKPSGTFPIVTHIFEKRAGGGIKLYTDRSTRVNRGEGITEYALRTGKKFKAPAYEHIYTGKKGKEYLCVYRPTPDTFIPMKVCDEGFKIIGDEDRVWLVQEMIDKSRTLEKRNKFLQLISIITPIILIMAVAIVCIIMIQQIDKVYQSADTIRQGLVYAADSIKEGFYNMTLTWNQVNVPPPPV